MADIPIVQAQIGGVVLSDTAATSGGDTISPPGDNVILLVSNGSASGITVDVTVPGNTKWGQAQPDVTSVSIPAGGLGVIGPLPRELADPSAGSVEVTASSTSSVNLYAIRV